MTRTDGPDDDPALLARRARAVALAGGVGLAAACFGLALVLGLGAPAAWTAAVTGLCAAWWVLEPIPIPATSLIPFAAFPLLGVLDHEAVAGAYGHSLILLLLGGFMLSVAVERSGVHRRFALAMVRMAGGGRSLVGAFMVASALCSMWISNTATVLMLLPVALAVIGPRGAPGVSGASASPGDAGAGALAAPLLLGIAYAASIGGLATPVGTPPNVIFMGIYREHTGVDVSFLEWMAIGLPATLVLLPIAWLLLTRGLGDTAAPRIPESGPWRPAEVRVLVVFGLTAAAWIFRTEPLGGWSALFGATGASDSTVALAAVVVMFLVPAGPAADGAARPAAEIPAAADGTPGAAPPPAAAAPPRALLDWEAARTIPWGLLLLFGGGIAISAAFKASGLSDAIGAGLGHMAGWNLVVVTAVLCVSVTFMTEVTSNTASTNLLMPILAAGATAAAIDPKLLMVPAALSASCAFMLPVATAPNAIVAGTEHVTTRRMMREGIALNFAGAVALTAVCALLL